MAKEPFKRETIDDRGLEKVPEFYKSLGNDATVNRLKGMDVRLRVPVIELFIRGKCPSTVNTIYFNKSFTKKPLVTGLLRAPDGTVKRLFPNNEQLTVSYAYVTIGSTSFPVTAGSIYHLKVYNLDLEGAVSRTNT